MIFKKGATRFVAMPFVLLLVVGIWANALAVETVSLEGPKDAIGVLELPKVFGSRDPNGPPGSRLSTPSEPIKIFFQPKKDALVLSVVHKPEALKTVEFDYEESGVVVYQKNNGWYLIGLPHGASRGWVASRDAGTFHPIEELLVSGSAFLTKSWDGKIRNTPGLSVPGKAVDYSNTPFEQDIKVVEAKRIDDRLWLRVELLTPGRCKGMDVKSIASGWIPAYSESGHLTAWFNARGC